MLEGTVTIAGKQFPKKGVFLAVGGVAVVGLAVAYKRQQAASAASTATATGDLTASANIDPATGFPYGSAEDAQALSDWQVSSGLPSNTFGGGGVGGTVQGPGAFANNAQWAQAAEQSIGSTGGDAKATALGRYLLGQPLGPDQRRAVEQAIAAQNPPPVAGPNGFPPAIRDKAVNPPPPPPKGHPTKEVAANGHDTLRDIAAHSGTTTYPQAEKLNPWAHRFTVKTKPIPAGFKVKVYAS